ncbi:hypothetical protein ACHAXN_002110 [Cyclotella atomus]
MKVHTPTKLGVRSLGPFTIEQVHINGTLTNNLQPSVTKRINIPRVLTIVDFPLPQ